MIAKRPLHAVLTPETLFPSQARTIIEQRLRDAILDGTLTEGTPIRQQEIADLYSVSRMPAREALRQLEAQGLLIGTQHRGLVVAPRSNESTSGTELSKADLLALLSQYPDDATFNFSSSALRVDVCSGAFPANASAQTDPANTSH